MCSKMVKVPDATRQELDDGLRFVHAMGQQVRQALADTNTRLLALVEQLIASGKLDAAAFARRRAHIRAREANRDDGRPRVHLAPIADKYALEGLPSVDCAGLLHLCKARCCRPAVELSIQDLDEGLLQWDYGRPYLVRKRADGSCVHQHPEHGGCTVYEHRPAACRVYDCRDDRRIWLDFAAKLPAP